MADKRNINMGNGNYNERIEGDYIQGDRVENKTDNSRKLEIGGDVNGGFNVTDSQFMSDQSQTNKKATVGTNEEKPIKKKPIGTIIAITAIVVSACVSGLFNNEIREWLGENTPLPTQEAPQNP